MKYIMAKKTDLIRIAEQGCTISTYSKRIYVHRYNIIIIIEFCGHIYSDLVIYL